MPEDAARLTDPDLGPGTHCASLLDALPQAALLLDEELRVRITNRRFGRVLPTPGEDPVGRRLFDLAQGFWDIPAVRELVAVAASGRDPGSVEFDRASGDGRWHRLRLQARRLQTGPILFLVEDASGSPRLSAGDDELIARAAHELRSPLGSIANWVHLLSQATKEGPLLQQGLSAIRRALKEGARLVDELSDMALLRAGRLRLRLDPVDLLPLVDMALEAPRSSAEQKGVKLVLVRQVSSLPVMGDPDRLQQIVLQLLRNAVSVTPAGGRVEVAVGRDGTSFWLAVSDTGRGIAPELLPRIFDRPLPRDLVAPRAQASLGVGLAIVKHLVELHGGKVEVSSPGLGKGACFLVRLPVPALLPPGFPFVGTSSPLLVEQRRVPSPPATLARVE